MTRNKRFAFGPRAGRCVSVSLLALLAACGGGGGGGGGGDATAASGGSSAAPEAALTAPATQTPAAVQAVDTVASLVTAPVAALTAQLVPAPAASFETAEYWRNYSLDMINASAAYATGASGQGVVVAVNDGLVDTGVAELAGRIAGGGRNLTDDTTVNTHATHLAGIIAANRNSSGMEGVAWSATILPVASFVDDGDGNRGAGSAPYDGIAYAADAGADIINNSWGSAVGDPQSAALVAAVRHAARLGAITVFSTGNEGKAQPGTTALVPQTAPDTQSLFVAVTAVGSNGVLATYANACGAAASWCLAAPGSRITSSDAGGGYVSMSGTSMAAAVVSGALAVVTSRFPELTSAQVVSRLLATADATGRYADSATYGRGLLDLGAATRPIGTLVANAVGSTVSTGSLTASAAGSSLTGNAVLGDALVHALAAVPVALFDSYDGATFAGDLGDLVSAGRGLDVGDLAFGDFGTGFFAARSGGPGLSLSLSERRQDIGAYAALQGLSRAGTETVVAARLALDKGTVLFAGLNAGFAEVAPAYADLPYQAGLALSDGAFVPGVLALADGGAMLGIDSALDGQVALTVTLMNKAPGDDIGAGGASAAEARLRFDAGGGLTLEGGIAYLREEGGMLGASGTGLLAVERAETVQVSVGARLALSADTMLYARYDRATTRSLDSGAFIGGAEIASDAWSLGVVGRNAAMAGDFWGFGAHQPLSGRGGDLVLDRPLGRDADGRVYGDTVAVGLDGGGREVDLEAFYALPVGERGLFGVNLLYVSQPGNSAAAPDEVLGMLRYRQRLW
ncbi:S8 family serine peptidase [Zavarzinia compransoris]|uniref:Peptidase S8/S53 domain-containing protein n=1 Tax=Zavarzinia compransoris TaxID=1264899 RepID=A0A317DYD6_9PROT|nr:S8 family serine peptidase [Zavarzinia compransoris]PWR18866.1 hypothetical protein DKG75_18000 [Zavarzinia compransoris]TDP48861.1 subtilisin family serine protease [Zavarzinia compransoris]